MQTSNLWLTTQKHPNLFLLNRLDIHFHITVYVAYRIKNIHMGYTTYPPKSCILIKNARPRRILSNGNTTTCCRRNSGQATRRKGLQCPEIQPKTNLYKDGFLPERSYQNKLYIKPSASVRGSWEPMLRKWHNSFNNFSDGGRGTRMRPKEKT